jgi:hypothetical protein
MIRELPAGAILDATSQKLIEAALYMEKHGHCKGAMFFESRVCVVGAISHVTAKWEVFDAAVVRLSVHLGVSAMLWNDRPETTAEDAIAALWGAALMERRV